MKDTGGLPKKPEPSALWLNKQRRALKHGTLSESRERALNEAVLEWKLSSEQRTGERETIGLTVVSGQAGI